MCGIGVSRQQGSALRVVACFGGFDECYTVADLEFAHHDEVSCDQITAVDASAGESGAVVYASAEGLFCGCCAGAECGFVVGVLANLDIASLEESVSCGDGVWQGVSVVDLVLLPSGLDELVVGE